MPIFLGRGGTTLLIRKAAFERFGLSRAHFDQRFSLADDEFRVERGMVSIGPVPNADSIEDLIAELEGLGLTHYDDFFDLSGNWPEWIALYAAAATSSNG